MNFIKDEILDYLKHKDDLDEETLIHYGVKRRSGRYPWGSGENPYQNSKDFLAAVEEKKKNNFVYVDEKGKKYTGETAIAKEMNLSTTQFRTQLALANLERRSINASTAKALLKKGYNKSEIARKMGFANESSVRQLLNESVEARKNQSMNTADFIREKIEEKGMIDVGSGVEKELNISKERLNQALYILEMEGYPIYGAGVPQVTNKGKQTNLKVICPKGTEYKDIYDFEKINSLRDYESQDDGQTYQKKWAYPKSMDSSRLKIRYAEDGGIEKDGIIELRRNVDDLSLGDSTYAQVRILVDNNKYLKGMAVYSDSMPDGIDVIFNTNKSKTTPKMEVLKNIKNNPNNPFGSLIKEGINNPDIKSVQRGGQSYYYDKDGKKQLSLINKRAEEGDWGKWADKLSAQFLSKQPKKLIEKQLNLSISDKYSEFDEIMSLTNPTIKKSLLKSFADDCDAAAVHLKAASLPRQKYQVIIPIPSLKDDEVYAPNYKSGETVALVRYPHGGTFEIPILKVNNKHAEAKKTLGTNPKDAIGINRRVAERLSGADFDGDTVMVIPCNSPFSKVKILSTPSLEELKGFDPKLEYGGKPTGTFKPMKTTQKSMGEISNLITDMTLKGASREELARAVKHSMVVIDAEKHGLDYKQSESDNNIKSLKLKYQGHVTEDGKIKYGASTLISKSKSEVSVLKRKGSPKIDPNTGEQTWNTADDLYYYDKKGKLHTRLQRSTLMAETKDAYSLVSDTKSPAEMAYAQYANTLKHLANIARLETLKKDDIQYSPQAKKTYLKEVESLSSKLNASLRNAPRERKAQTIANSVIQKKKTDYPDLTKEEVRKLSQQALVEARSKVGAKRTTIDVSPKEWDAIQAGAISPSNLRQIINHIDKEKLMELAMPRNTTQLSQAKINKIASMSLSGYTNSEIAEALNISSSSVAKYL